MQEYADAFASDDIPSAPTDQLWADLWETVLSIVEKRVPSKTTAARYNTSIRKAIRRKQRAHKKARKTGKKRDIDSYKRLQAEVKYDIKEAGKGYLENIISEDFNSNAKKFWSYIKNKRQESNTEKPGWFPEK